MAGILRDLCSEVDKRGIRENLEEQYFEFYVAGYTKTCKNVSVQPNHVLLFNDAFELQKRSHSKLEQEYLFPFGQRNPMTTVELVPQPDNAYDSNALIVVASHPMNILEYEDGTNTKKSQLILGYVPAKISRIVSHNLHKLKSGWIKKVRTVHNQKTCSTKIAIPWQPAPREEDLLMMDQLADLVEFED